MTQGDRERAVRTGLLLVPPAVYVLSYVYLAWYHQRANLLGTVVHEGGRYTLIETCLYASHFLGHIPVHTVLAVLFVGTLLSLSPPPSQKAPMKILPLGLGLALLVGGSLVGSILTFGWDDTAAFLLQRKQQVNLYAEGGSWNLHLPSTLMLFLLAPLYVYLVYVAAGRPVGLHAHGLGYIVVAASLAAFLTWTVNSRPREAVLTALTHPRYLAHGVRELLTFPLTYFPIPLYAVFRREAGIATQPSSAKRPLAVLMATLAILFAFGLTLMTIVPLRQGIGELAQKPAFARGGRLGIAYLVSSHYFEHILDTIYFALLSLLLYRCATPSKAGACRN